MTYRGITPGSAYWNELLSGDVITYHLVYAELGDPTSTELRLTNSYKNITMDGYTFVFVDIDTFQINGIDVTTHFVAGKRLQFIDGVNIYYGTIDSSSFSTNTTVEVTMEGGDNLTNSITAVYRTQSGDLAGRYNAAGSLLEISTFEESLALNVHKLTIGLDGVNGAAVADLLLHRYIDRTVKIWQGLMDSNETPIVDPILLMDGRISDASVDNDPEASTIKVTVAVSSQWADFERKGGIKTNDRDHQRHYPNDKGFEFSAASKKHMKWGEA